MIAKNSINLNKIAELLRSSGDIRSAVQWSKTSERYVSSYNGYDQFFPSSKIDADYFASNTKILKDVAEIGTRPNCNLRLEVTIPGQYYLIKFSDGSVRLTTDSVSYDSSPTGTIIAEADENIKFLICELLGGGGGGAGGGSIFSGCGGASGGYILGLIKLEHEAGANWAKNSLPLRVGSGGSGIRDRNQAGNGEDTGFWISNNLALCAAGGNGANGGDEGSARVSLIAGVDDIFHSFYIIQGRSGHNGGGHDNSGPYEFTGLGPAEENTKLTYPSFSSGSGTVYGGDGGNSVMAAGGSCPSGTGKNGNNGTGFGAGGAGGSGAPTSTGGNGINGVIRFYY